MARNKVMKLWNAVVTAFLALCTALGLITTTASAAVPQTDEARNSDSAQGSITLTTPLGSWSLVRALPPTMKQRIHAEAHGKSPSCRHSPQADTTDGSDPTAQQEPPAQQDSAAQPESTGRQEPADCSDDTTSSRAEPATGRIPLQR
ncbi:DUF6344 domain-containing protein [Streptomyces fungicidicus]|uniref:DUF6344 domain-containing protein n=1 Tax=Streptomyces fungicidicus TaxID=68203 RepID=UPI0033C2BE6A